VLVLAFGFKQYSSILAVEPLLAILMTTFMQRLLLSVFLVLIAVGSLSAQYRVSSKYWTIGGTIGASGYEGDLTNLDNPGVPLTQLETIKQPGFNIGFTAAYHFKPRWAVRGSLGYLLLRGSDEKSTKVSNRNRNLSFENGIIEASGVLMFDLLPARRNYRLRRKFNPYVFAGIAAAYSDPRAKIVTTSSTGATTPVTYNATIDGVTSTYTFAGVPVGLSQWVKLRDLRTEGQSTAYSPIVISIPFGGGVRYKLTERIDIGLEINFRRSFSDYIDDVSGAGPFVTGPGLDRQAGFYPLPIQLGNDPLRVAASNRYIGVTGTALYADRRGSDKNSDWYGSVGFTFSYILDKSPGGVSCPKPGGRRKGFLGIF
jgi:opacity protein-like surface antigen